MAKMSFALPNGRIEPFFSLNIWQMIFTKSQFSYWWALGDINTLSRYTVDIYHRQSIGRIGNHVSIQFVCKFGLTKYLGVVIAE